MWRAIAKWLRSLFRAILSITFIFTFTYRAHGTIQTALLPEIKPIITFKCEKPLQKHFTGKVDLYSVGWRALRKCNTTKGKWLGLITCRGNHINSFKTSKLLVKDIENYQILGGYKIRQMNYNFLTKILLSTIAFCIDNLKGWWCDCHTVTKSSSDFESQSYPTVDSMF